jgi:hypothetical protein
MSRESHEPISFKFQTPYMYRKMSMKHYISRPVRLNSINCKKDRAIHGLERLSACYISRISRNSVREEKMGGKMVHGILARNKKEFNPKRDEHQAGTMQMSLTRLCSVPLP